MLSNLEMISDDVIPLFEMAAEKYIKDNNGNAVNALAKALSFISNTACQSQ